VIALAKYSFYSFSGKIDFVTKDKLACWLVVKK